MIIIFLISDLSNDIQNEIDDINNSIPDEYTSDYVTPIKFHNFTLNADDLLYESKRNLNNNNNNNGKLFLTIELFVLTTSLILEILDYFSAFSGTGTFRSKSSQIWDPHPEYILNAFGQRLHLVLHQDTSFIPPKTFRVRGNNTKILNHKSNPHNRFVRLK